MICIIACMSRNRTIGLQGKMPWRFPADLKNFKKKTLGHTLVMGRKTYEGVGKLPGRDCIVLSRWLAGRDEQGAFWTPDVDIVDRVEGDVFIAGGAEIYNIYLRAATYMMLTYIHKDIEGDTFFPKFEASEWETVEAHRGNQYSYIEMQRHV